MDTVSIFLEHKQSREGQGKCTHDTNTRIMQHHATRHSRPNTHISIRARRSPHCRRMLTSLPGLKSKSRITPALPGNFAGRTKAVNGLARNGPNKPHSQSDTHASQHHSRSQHGQGETDKRRRTLIWVRGGEHLKIAVQSDHNECDRRGYARY